MEKVTGSSPVGSTIRSTTAELRRFFSTHMLKKLVVALCVASAAFAAPEKWAKDIEKLTANDAAHPPPQNAVVFVGSSSIVKWTSLEKDFPDQKVINRGFGGSELADSVFYADKVVLPYHPRVVVLYAGDNDLNAGKAPETVAADFKAFCGKIHAALPQTRVVFIAVKPSPSRWKIREQGEKANALIRAYCAEDQRRVFVDVWQPMLDAKGEPRPELFVADMLHMNAKGYEIWTPLVARAIK